MAEADLSPGRIVALEGGHNFREVGGLPAGPGARLRRGLIWRSAGLDRLTQADCEVILDLGIRTIADLRTESERLLFPTPSALADHVRILTWTSEAEAESRHANAAWRDMPLDELRATMVLAYPRIADGHRPHAKGLIQAIADGGAPALVHCTAGKDRTGVLVALLLDLVGVPRDLILDDYELTGAHLRKAWVNLEGVVGVGGQASWMAGLKDEARDLVLGVERAYLLAALAAIDDRFGSIEAFAIQGLGLSDKTLEALRSRLLERDMSL